jgi:hypothetical protein
LRTTAAASQLLDGDLGIRRPIEVDRSRSPLRLSHRNPSER